MDGKMIYSHLNDGLLSVEIIPRFRMRILLP